jgi:hypothetical protein
VFSGSLRKESFNQKLATVAAEALRKAGQKGADPTKKAWSDAAALVKSTLTVQQLAKLAVYEQANGSPMWGVPFRPGPATQSRW